MHKNIYKQVLVIISTEDYSYMIQACVAASAYNIFISENITFVQAALGGKIEVETLHGKKILTIPRGCRDGSKLMLKGMGVKRERSCGDQLVELSIQFPAELTEEQESLLNKLNETMKGEK